MRLRAFGFGAAALVAVVIMGAPRAAATEAQGTTGAKTGASRAAYTSRRAPAADVVPASAIRRPEVYLLRGLFNVFSLGMDDLAQKLQAQGFPAAVYNHTAWSALADSIIAARAAGDNRPIVLVGHSLGGDDVIKLADRLNQAGIPVDLLAPVDPVSPGLVPPNVRRVVNYFQSNNGWGQAVQPGDGFKGALVNADLETNRRDLSDPGTGHITIDKGDKVHADILREVMGIGVAQAAPPPRKKKPQRAPIPAPPGAQAAAPAPNATARLGAAPGPTVQ